MNDMTRGFLEMEMVSAKELAGFVKELDRSGCRYIIGCSKPVMVDGVAFHDVVSVYGELPTEYAGGMEDESAFGFDNLEEKFEFKYGV